MTYANFFVVVIFGKINAKKKTWCFIRLWLGSDFHCWYILRIKTSHIHKWRIEAVLLLNKGLHDEIPASVYIYRRYNIDSIFSNIFLVKIYIPLYRNLFLFWIWNSSCCCEQFNTTWRSLVWLFFYESKDDFSEIIMNRLFSSWTELIWNFRISREASLMQALNSRPSDSKLQCLIILITDYQLVIPF